MTTPFVLEELDDSHATAFIEMLEEFRSQDPASYESVYARKEWNVFEFRKFVKECDKARFDWRPPKDKVSVSHFVMRGAGKAILAHAILRFPLDEATERNGGNIVVDVPPSMRRKGHGSYCMALTLFEAVRAGLSRVLVTASAKDVGARKMIERNRGEFLDEVGGVVRYWIRFR